MVRSRGGFGRRRRTVSLHNTPSLPTTLTIHGIDDVFVEHGTQDELWRDLRLDAAGIAEVVKEILQSTKA
jgi:deoxyxylulose-5-phosphate synthase